MARSVHITKIKIIQHAISDMLSICYFDQFDNASPHQSKMIVSTQEKLCCLPVCKKTNSFVTCFLRYHKDMSILPWYLLHVQPNLSKKIVSIRKILQKLHFFLEILQRHHILVILSTSHIPGNTHQIWQYQLVENIICSKKKQIHPSLLS